MDNKKEIYWVRPAESCGGRLIFSGRRGGEESGGTSRFEKLEKTDYTPPKAFLNMKSGWRKAR